MQILTLGEDKIKEALTSEFTPITVEHDEGGLGVTSYVSANMLGWTRVIGSDESGLWDVHDLQSEAAVIVRLEPWEERIITS